LEWWKKEKTIQIKILPFLQDQNKKESNNIIEDHTNKKKLGIQIKLKKHWKRFYKVKKKKLINH
jgi:hypothetical protein